MPTREFNPAGCSGSRYFLVHPGAGGSAEVYRFRCSRWGWGAIREYVNYPGEHSRLWLEIKLRLPPFFHDCGPKDWRRGRGSYNINNAAFRRLPQRATDRPRSLRQRFLLTSSCRKPRLNAELVSRIR